MRIGPPGRAILCFADIQARPLPSVAPSLPRPSPSPGQENASLRALRKQQEGALAEAVQQRTDVLKVRLHVTGGRGRAWITHMSLSFFSLVLKVRLHVTGGRGRLYSPPISPI